MKANQPIVYSNESTKRDHSVQEYFTWQAQGIGFVRIDPSKAAKNSKSCPANLPAFLPADTPLQLQGMIRYSSSGILPTEAKVSLSIRQKRCQKDLDYVRSYIQCHYAERLTIKELAALIDTSPAYLGRMFHKKEGVSLRTFLENTRLDRAAALLRGTDRPVASIAREIGFGDESYFCRRFRTAYGKTPGDYRRACGLKYGEAF
ncbi:MAG: helix-turn-helix domain-containing protein [Lachnospiraceae bacterium]